MKNIIRKKMLAKRNSLSEGSIEKKSLIIFNRLKKLPEFRSAKTIMLYISFGSEVKTQLMIKSILLVNKKIISVPVISGDKIIPSRINSILDINNKHRFGVMEPSIIKKIRKDSIDIIIVPGIAFDKKGYRIGYGKGYYDRFLKNFKGNTIGIAFKEQVIDTIPHMPHDIPVQKLVVG